MNTGSHHDVPQPADAAEGDHTPTPLRPSRRSMLLATAWATPVVAIAIAAPSASASPSVDPDALTLSSAVFRVAPSGRLPGFTITATRQASPVLTLITVLLPTGFSWADGLGGQSRDLSTNAAGVLALGGSGSDGTPGILAPATTGQSGVLLASAGPQGAPVTMTASLSTIGLSVTPSAVTAQNGFVYPAIAVSAGAGSSVTATLPSGTTWANDNSTGPRTFVTDAAGNATLSGTDTGVRAGAPTPSATALVFSLAGYDSVQTLLTSLASPDIFILSVSSIRPAQSVLTQISIVVKNRSATTATTGGVTILLNADDLAVGAAAPVGATDDGWMIDSSPAGSTTYSFTRQLQFAPTGTSTLRVTYQRRGTQPLTLTVPAHDGGSAAFADKTVVTSLTSS